MDAIIITEFGGPEVLQRKTLPKPAPVPGEVLIHVRAFGVNHAEMHMRKGEWDEWDPVSGLECVGTVAACPGGEVPLGSKVMGVMGGMGRDRPGGYAEFVNVPTSNVVRIETGLPWEELAALPEVYCTAYTCLFTILDLQRGERLLVRGATSTVGQAALNLAVSAGAVVTATTRQEARFPRLRQMGAADVKLERPELEEQFDNPPRFDKVLNLVGNSVLLESIGLARPGGRMLQAGWLGGLAPVADFNPMLQMKPSVHFSLFHSKVLGSPDFPLSGIPMQDIVRRIEAGEWDAKPSHVFGDEDIQGAHRMLDSQAAGGKIVVLRRH
ncbi:related to NADPH quinone oxidoreductase homolog PIG3 [Cephalotrichum gorgonifer]|uniref:Related to NADPH quinone oxidoreductase homolog PIG3 n=1 Tax=Cephalotrichum gorgonifer TaxID=2041049 RepID=A0AAE8MQZ7_9PEZI|nr:related to NADPH quinone oxidoreductase homolog PIG3 [Cephalotrichum gorgonifer]